MRAITASERLRIWERGRRLTLAARSLMLLAAALPESSTDDLARLSIGRRDALLLTLREVTFGPSITGHAVCPQCDESLDLMFHASEIRAMPESEMSIAAPQSSLKLDGFEIAFRPPDSTDLEAIAECQSAAEAHDRLLERCARQVRRPGPESEEPLSPSRLPTDVVHALVRKMSEIDPQANVQLDLTCPGCEQSWRAVFDIASFFWRELHDWAVRTLQQVHTIAWAYGWVEADILEMSVERRSYYVEMIARARVDL